MKGLYYDDEDIQASSIGYAIIDSGTSLFYIGQSDYVMLMRKLLAKAPELNCEDSEYCFSDQHTCDYFTDKLAPITVRLANNHYTIQPEGYMFSGNGRQSKMCTVAISYMSDTQGLFILGDTFMRNFVTTFDNDSEEIRLAVNINAPAGTKIEWKISGW